MTPSNSSAEEIKETYMRIYGFDYKQVTGGLLVNLKKGLHLIVEQIDTIAPDIIFGGNVVEGRSVTVQSCATR